jgi:hypothetical protein
MSMLAPDSSKSRTIAHPAKSETTETHKIILEIIIYEQKFASSNSLRAKTERALQTLNHLHGVGVCKKKPVTVPEQSGRLRHRSDQSEAKTELKWPTIRNIIQ